MTQLTPGTALGFLLADAARLYRRSFEEQIEVSGLALTAGEVRTLAYVTTHEGSRQSFLADLMGVEPMTLSAYIDSLERQRLVTRETDGSDRRAKVIRSTKLADSIFERMLPVATTVYRRAVSGLTDGQVRMLETSLIAVRANFEKAATAGSVANG